jgi:hypothetical protein
MKPPTNRELEDYFMKFEILPAVTIKIFRVVALYILINH